MNKRNSIHYLLAASLFVAATGAAMAADGPKTYEVTLKGKVFTPREIMVKAGQPFRIKLTNQNGKPAEFESSALGFEKIVAGSSEILVNVRPQKPGKYKFFDEFQSDEAFGYVEAQ